MDDIYGDLENYNDVNIIVELRNENKELKFKLEEYATNMDKLQKNILQDFDKISSEFKKMEINYSSLLKTARAEIERKTQIITNLNMEKDMMVLNSIQNSNKSLLLLRRNMMRDKPSNRKPEGKPIKGGKDIQEPKPFEAERERLDENRLPSTDTVSTENTDDINKVGNIENKLGKLEMYDKSSECKENVKVKRAQGLRNRRKSMPALNKQLAKFSSDEEYGDNRSAEGVTNEWPPRDDNNRRTYDRHKQFHKISETSGIDEKYSSYHESSRETYYKGKPHRYSDKYRNPRDKYEAQRFKRHFSPERGRRPRDFQDDVYQRSELPRHRVLESPPHDKYDPQRRYRERRPNYEDDGITDDRTKYRQDRVVGKHKASSDYPEPYGKRAKIDHCSNPAVSVEEDNQWRRGDAPPPPPPQQKAFPEFQKQLFISCQSPDYKPDVISQPVKEIRHTAIVELEDPRNMSKKYTKKIEGNQVIISTIIGRNVPLKVIDKSTWKIPQVKVPKALQRPPRSADEYTELLYADLENPVSNMSVESGEIHSETNDGFMADYVTRSFFQDYENEREYQKSLRDQGVDFPYRGHDDIENLCRNTTDMNLKHPGENADVNLKSNFNVAETKTNVDKVCDKPSQHDIETKLCQDNIKTTTIPCQSNIKTNLEPHCDETYSKSSQNPVDTNVRSSCINDKALPKPLQQYVSEKSNFDETQPTSQPAKYKIPKKRTERDSKEANAPNPLGVLLGQFHSICGVSKEAKPPEPKLDVDKTFGPDEEIIPQRKENVEDTIQKRELKDRRKMTAREIVAVDLELSDETCDNVEEQKMYTKGNEKSLVISEHASQKTEPNVKHTLEPESPGDKSKNNNKSTTVTKISAEKNAGETVRKNTRKTSKKTQKQKPTKEPSKDKVTEKKTRSKVKESKIEENKSKFRELFGDSSLITPEDLGIPTEQTANTKKYEPIFEDAQDATDVNVGKVGTQKQSCKSKDISSVVESLPVVTPYSEEKEKIHSLRISLPNILKQNVDVRKEKKKLKDHLPIQQVMPHIDVVNKEVDIKEPYVVKTLIDSTEAQSRINEIESQIPNNNEDETIHEEIVNNKPEVHSIQQVTPNMNVGNLEVDTKDSDVVKTVIISTGVQHRIAEIESQILNMDVDKALDTLPKVQEQPTVAKEIPILALATSTPHKNHLHIETSVESSCNSSDTGVDQSTPAAVETQNVEVPDVRIFVRRRRKLKK